MVIKSAAKDLALFGGTPVRTKPFHGWPVYGAEEETYLLNALRNSNWTMGKRSSVIQEFAQRFADYHGAAAAVACTNCTQALEIMLSVAGVEAGDEVIVPAYTFIASASSVAKIGAVPVFADIERDTYVLDAQSAESMISAKTKAIMAVHFGGQFADMEKLTQIAGKHNLLLIEDAAQAHGAKWNGRFPGHYGAAAGFSFQYSKNMTAGEGGIIIGVDGTFVEKCWQHIWHGRRKGGRWYEHFETTSNYRMTEWSAAILLAQLGRLAAQNQRRMENADYLTKLLIADGIVFPPVVDSRTEIHPRHLLPVRFNRHVFGDVPKSTIVQALQAEGIPVLGGYDFPLYGTPAFQTGKWGIRGVHFDYSYDRIHLPVAEEACRDTFWFIHHIFLGPRTDMEDLALAIRKVGDHAAALGGSR